MLHNNALFTATVTNSRDKNESNNVDFDFDAEKICDPTNERWNVENNHKLETDQMRACTLCERMKSVKSEIHRRRHRRWQWQWRR